MNVALSRAGTWSESTHGTISTTGRAGSKISPLSSSIRLPLLSSVRMRSGVARGAEECCAATMQFVSNAAMTAYERRSSCIGGTNNDVGPYLNNKPYVHADEPNSDQVRTILVVHFVAHIWATSWLPRCKPSADLHRSQRISMIRIINMFNILKSKGGEEEDA